ncbi:GerMN domain-containing protein [Symbioplanes lichenis]|uniref:GerMN domain-containing protein n=1 Tax=Symbioplanes lichenis TaxID=1629072 RepID=UPI002739538E|nr:GerMN domain-containing protein [Actinoplanes lichenis]
MRRRSLGTLALALAAGGCGVPLDDEPRPIETPGRIDASGNPVPNGAGSVALRLYFVRDGRLVRVPRRVPAPLTPREQLDALLAGPTTEESADGLTSALSTMTVTGMTLADRRATITLADRDNQPPRSDEVLAFGQIVCTLTSQTEVGTVSFEAEAQPLYVPRADGSLSNTPLTVADYSGLLD